MYEIMNTKKEHPKEKEKASEYTFDYEGRMIQIQKMRKSELPVQLENSKVKVQKKYVVSGNFI